MESSAEEDDYPCMETITPQAKIESNYQSNTEMGIRKVCCELLELKDAVDSLCGNMRAKYSAFWRLQDEVDEAEHELKDLRKHISTHEILLRDVTNGVLRKLKEFENCVSDVDDYLPPPPTLHLDDPNTLFLQHVDVLLAERQIAKATEALCSEEKRCPQLLADSPSEDDLQYRSSFAQRKTTLEDYLVELANRDSVSLQELKESIGLLIKLGKGPLAQQLMLKAFRVRLQMKIESIVGLSGVCVRTFPDALSKLVFSVISVTVKESGATFGDDPVYINRIVQWAEWEIESFVRLAKENSPSPDTVLALCFASNYVQASVSYCLLLEAQNLKLSKFLLVLSRPYIDEVLEFNYRRARKELLAAVDAEDSFLISPNLESPAPDLAEAPDNLLNSGVQFMRIIEEILGTLTPLMISHFGASILARTSQLFDKYMDAMIKSLPEPSDDETLNELKESVHSRVESDSEKLALLGTAFTIQDKLLLNAVRDAWAGKNEAEEEINDSMEGDAILKEWKRNLQHAFDRLKDHFCRQYILSFIYSREGKTRLNAQIYVNSDEDDESWESNPLPSLPFLALLSKLQQLATVAGDVLLGKEKLQKILLARLTETVVMWLSDEKEFWSVFEDESVPIKALGLQQLILDMHFVVEIPRFAGYLSRNVHQIASAIIARAIRTCANRGIDTQSALPEDEWFVETAKSAINKLLLGTAESDSSEDDHHIIGDDDLHETTSTTSSIESAASFVSARSTGDLSPIND